MPDKNLPIAPGHFGETPNNGEEVEGYDEWRDKYVPVTYDAKRNRFKDDQKTYPIARMSDWRGKKEETDDKGEADKT